MKLFFIARRVLNCIKLLKRIFTISEWRERESRIEKRISWMMWIRQNVVHVWNLIHFLNAIYRIAISTNGCLLFMEFLACCCCCFHKDEKKTVRLLFVQTTTANMVLLLMIKITLQQTWVTQSMLFKSALQRFRSFPFFIPSFIYVYIAAVQTLADPFENTLLWFAHAVSVDNRFCFTIWHSIFFFLWVYS